MTAGEKSLDTKKKILNAANELFARHGYIGSSVRDIAKQAEVNVAAINYHFENKENLYLQVFHHNYESITIKIQELSKTAKSTADLAVKTFQFFMNSGSSVMNTFRIFLSDDSPLNDENFQLHPKSDECYGPPGGEHFKELIQKDLKGNISDNTCEWVVKMTYSMMVHFGVILNTKVMQARCQHDKNLSPELIESFIRESVVAHLEHVKKNPEIFK